MNQHLDSLQSAKILIVEDNESNRLLARTALEHEGYAVCLARDAEEGLALFETETIGCILLDVRLPGIDGFAACERIRAMPHGKDTPVIFLTGMRDVETFDRALRAGGDDFLTKPVRPTELVVRVRAALQLRSVRTELKQHYELLKRQRDDMMRLQLQKERIMAFVVHDLKNPVNSMDLHAQVLLRDRLLPADARESATQIRSEARVLSRMILNLLDLSKADEGKLEPHFTHVDVTALVRGVCAELEVSARRREVTLRTALEVPYVRADAELLRRTVTNLVENAIRHTRQNTVVEIAVVPRESETQVRVRDAGAGVRAEMKERIFEAFVQGDRESSDVSGRGLGLAFCHSVATAHGGRIWVEDADPGSVFCLALPHAE